MIMSVSILIIFRGAATPSSTVNLSISVPAGVVTWRVLGVLGG
jgi:hypothetical protein